MLSTEALFDPRTYANARRSALEAETLPPEAYTSDAFYGREVERIFMKEWNFMGRADHLQQPGEYAAMDLVGVPLILVRDRQGQLRAFANSCRHRGSQLVKGEGHCKSFRCPCHNSSFHPDGTIVQGQCVSPRDMDLLDVDQNALAQGEVKVKFENFSPGMHDKKPVT